MQVWCPRLYLSSLTTSSKKIKAYHPWAKGNNTPCQKQNNSRVLGLSFECPTEFCCVQSCPKVRGSTFRHQRGCDKIFVGEGPRTWRLVSENLATDYRSHLNHWMLERGYIWSTRLGQEGGDERSRASIVPGMCMVATCLVHTHWWTKGTGWRLRWASSRASLRLPLSSVDRDQHVRARFRSHIPATK